MVGSAGASWIRSGFRASTLVFPCGGQPGVVVVHGWTPEGYEVVATYGSISEWLRSVISDLEEWAETGANLRP